MLKFSDSDAFVKSLEATFLCSLSLAFRTVFRLRRDRKQREPGRSEAAEEYGAFLDQRT